MTAQRGSDVTIDNPPLSGVYLPLVTPFFEGEVDYGSIERLLARYRRSGIAGLILLGTTGESPVLSPDESERIVDLVSTVLQGSLPLYLGVSGNDTKSVATTVQRSHRLAVDGYLITSPYYNRPSQSGLIAHFDAVVSETDRNVIVYNIPYRTGVNLHNSSLFELVERNPQIVGVKDTCGDITQTLESCERAGTVCVCSLAKTTCSSRRWPSAAPAVFWLLRTSSPRRSSGSSMSCGRVTFRRHWPNGTSSAHGSPSCSANRTPHQSRSGWRIRGSCDRRSAGFRSPLCLNNW